MRSDEAALKAAADAAVKAMEAGGTPAWSEPPVKDVRAYTAVERASLAYDQMVEEATSFARRMRERQAKRRAARRAHEAIPEGPQSPEANTAQRRVAYDQAYKPPPSEPKGGAPSTPRWPA